MVENRLGYPARPCPIRFLENLPPSFTFGKYCLGRALARCPRSSVELYYSGDREDSGGGASIPLMGLAILVLAGERIFSLYIKKDHSRSSPRGALHDRSSGGSGLLSATPYEVPQERAVRPRAPGRLPTAALPSRRPRGMLARGIIGPASHHRSPGCASEGRWVPSQHHACW